MDALDLGGYGWLLRRGQVLESGTPARDVREGLRFDRASGDRGVVVSRAVADGHADRRGGSGVRRRGVAQGDVVAEAGCGTGCVRDNQAQRRPRVTTMAVRRMALAHSQCGNNLRGLVLHAEQVRM